MSFWEALRGKMPPWLAAKMNRAPDEGSALWLIVHWARELGRREMVAELTKVEMALEVEKSMVAALEDVLRETAKLRPQS